MKGFFPNYHKDSVELEVSKGLKIDLPSEQRSYCFCNHFDRGGITLFNVSLD